MSEHKRRVHYSGKYPKKFEEKYKEHNPEKYADTIKHVIEKGSTPAGMHISICVNEILECFDIKPGQQGLDCTFGYGGHTRKMLEQLKGDGKMVVLDVDPIESAKSLERLRNDNYGEDILSLELTNFANIDEVVAKYGKFDFILADLGVSSMQIDNPERGFSYKVHGPLDLRMNPHKGISAAERLSELDKDEITGMLIDNSDEPFAEEIAKEIIKNRKSGKKIETTTDLREILEKIVEANSKGMSESEKKELKKKTCQRVFQALRIDVNNEYEVLDSLLSKLPDALNAGGKVVFLTFHSGEDRLVKRAFKDGLALGVYSDCAKDVIRPGEEECRINPRAKSTKLRWAIRS